MKKAILIALIVVVCVAIGFFIGNNLFVEDNSEWQEQYDLGLKYLNEGRYEEAIVAFSAAITIDPYQTSPYMRRVECYAAVGGEENYRKAIQDCETILSLDDTLTSVWLGAAELIEVLDGPEAALDFLRPGLDATENASSISDRIKELEDKSPAIQETETTISEEVAEEETQSVVQETTVSNADPGMAAYLGATTNDLIENYGLNYYTDYWEGGKFIKFDSVDAMFFYDQTTNEVFNIVCGGSETVTQGLTADMTYIELRAAAGSMGVTLDPPESYYNQMDDRNEYFVRFKIGELSLDYTWLDTPFENAPYEVTLMGTAPQAASADVPNEVAEAETIRFMDIPSEFIFTSGAGAWSTDLTIAEDGTFEGAFHDSNMGETGVEHPNGTIYYCGFTGKFSEPVQINQFVYKMELIELTTNDVEGYSYIENGVKYIAGTPYGFDGPTEYFLYLPGIPSNMMPESCFAWAKRLGGADQGKCNSYVICSSNGELPFMAET